MITRKMSTVQLISESFIKPDSISNEVCYLAPHDICFLSFGYAQNGLLFKKPTPLQENFMENLLKNLKHSLSLALVHFYPFTGRLVTHQTQDPPCYSVFIDCKNSPGAKFIYATLDSTTISDILSPIDVPPIFKSLFDFELQNAINHDGHIMPLLSIQVTELTDGVFIGCSMNHAIGDGTSYWNFWNSRSEVFQAQSQGHGQGNQDEYVEVPIQHPIHSRWFPRGVGPLINLPFKHHDDFICRYEPPKLRERIFHFSTESFAKLKKKASIESNIMKISSFQALSALVWRCITRARHLSPDQLTTCKLAMNIRSRIDPPLPKEYFGNAVIIGSVQTTAGKLLEMDLGWAACELHRIVVNCNDGVVWNGVEEWLKSPSIYQMSMLSDLGIVTMTNSPKFKMYENEFGMGKAVAVRSGYSNKCDGKTTWYPGQEGGGSIDLEVCLLPHNMIELESDEEFMNAVSVFIQCSL